MNDKNRRKDDKKSHENMIVVYLAGALRGEHKVANMKKAEFWSEKLWRLGYAVYSPHMNSGWLDTPETDPHVLKANIHLMKMCDIMVVMPNYEKSQGTLAEIDVCKLAGIPVVYISIADNNTDLCYTMMLALEELKGRNLISSDKGGQN